jgi:ATP-grasp domain-containing protein
VHLLYPSNPLNSRDPDEQYVEESKVATEMGFEYSIFPFEYFLAGKFRPIPELRPAEMIVYRGWMMKPQEYLRFHDAICATGAVTLTSPQQYELCHHLPRWYPILESYTPETLFFNESDDIGGKLRSLSWTSCFLKDHVKSVATAGGSMARDVSEIPVILERMMKYRGEIEGGVCARRIEDFDPKSESRHFVYQGKPFSRTGDTPEIVAIAAQRILSPFFSVDVARRRDGVLRIIELGDGQVSDRKDWTARELLEIFQAQTLMDVK